MTIEQLSAEIVKLGEVISKRLFIVEDNQNIIKKNQFKLAEIMENIINGRTDKS